MNSRALFLLLWLTTLGGCVAPRADVATYGVIDTHSLLTSNLNLKIPGLGPCTDDPERDLSLNADEPVVVLVHGCGASAGRFLTLSQVFAQQSQQSVCFSYDDRDSIRESADALAVALERLGAHMRNRSMTLIGHSQGGLVAREALSAQRRRPLRADLELRLVSISSPYGGIRAADHCGSRTARILSLGLVVPVCMLITGDKWNEISTTSEFIRNPGILLGQVGEFIKIDTDERDSCRRYGANGGCLEDDYVFSVEEQQNPLINGGTRMVVEEVKAGHAEIVGYAGAVPNKLIALLQRHGVMRAGDLVGLEALYRH